MEVAYRLRANRGPEVNVPDWDPEFIPGPMKLARIAKAGGGPREIWVPSDYDLAQGLYHYLGVAGPIAQALADEDTHEFHQGRGVHTAVEQLLRIVQTHPRACLVKTDRPHRDLASRSSNPRASLDATKDSESSFPSLGWTWAIAVVLLGSGTFLWLRLRASKGH